MASGWSVLVCAIYSFMSAAFVLFHLRVLRNFKPEDWMVRGGLLLVMLIVSALMATWALGMPRDGTYLLVFLTCFFTAGVITLTGLVIQLWKHRFSRDSGPMQYYLRNNPKEQ